jgi:hypothetical protein
MAVATQLGPREYRVPELAHAIRSGLAVPPKVPQAVECKNRFQLPLDEPEDFHDLPPVEAWVSGAFTRRPASCSCDGGRLKPQVLLDEEPRPSANADNWEPLTPAETAGLGRTTEEVLP